MAKRAPFQSVLQKFRPTSKRSLVVVALGIPSQVRTSSKGSPVSGSRYVPLRAWPVLERPTLAVVSSTSFVVKGEMACTGMRMSWLPVCISHST